MPVAGALARHLCRDELDAVFLVGNHTANGWVAEFHGRPSLFVALELLGAPPYDGILVSHEAQHVTHNHHGAETWPASAVNGFIPVVVSQRPVTLARWTS